MQTKTEEALELDENLYDFIVGSKGYYELDPLNPWFGKDYFTIVLSETSDLLLEAGNIINHNNELYRVIASMNDGDFTRTFWATVVRNEDYKEWE